MGGIQITVPEGFDVELNVIPFMGGRELKLRNVPLIPGSPRIIINGFAMMGGVDVRSRPSRTGKEIGQSIIEHVLGAVDAMPSLSGGPGPIDLDSLKKDIGAYGDDVAKILSWDWDFVNKNQNQLAERWTKTFS